MDNQYQYIDFFRKKRSIALAEIKINEKTFEDYKQLIKDESYFKFLSIIENGGLYFNQSLQLYSFSRTKDFWDIEFVNEVLNKEYGSLFENLVSFGQEIFGNQFVFDLSTQKIFLFNCESGQRDILANDFKSWLDVLFSDFNYYTGLPYAERWCEERQLEFNQRLVPIKPFVIGGDYDVKNFYTLDFPKYLAYNADIAKQIFILKDGEKVKLTFKNLKEDN